MLYATDPEKFCNAMGFTVSHTRKECYTGVPVAEKFELGKAHLDQSWVSKRQLKNRKHIIKKTPWESFQILFGNIRAFSVMLVYGTMLIVFLLGFYAFSMWWVKRDQALEAQKERQARIDKVNARRAERKKQRQILEQQRLQEVH